jgi:GTP cyclohydrolase II
MEDVMDTLKVTKQATARIPTVYGEFELTLYTNTLDEKEHLALSLGPVSSEEGVLVRVHSECFTGDVLGSRRCDCGEQLEHAMQLVADEGTGVIVYLRQEGRGIGLLEKLKAYNLQDQGFDTVEANVMLGHEPDERDYSIAAQILEDLAVRSARLMTNNPAKIDALTSLGVPITERVPLQEDANSDNAAYLLTKVHRMDHLLDAATLVKFVSTSSNGSGNGRHQA